MSSRVRVLWYQLSDPRKVTLLLSLSLLLLALTGCGDVIPATCPPGGGGCGNGSG